MEQTDMNIDRRAWAYDLQEMEWTESLLAEAGYYEERDRLAHEFGVGMLFQGSSRRWDARAESREDVQGHADDAGEIHAAHRAYVRALETSFMRKWSGVVRVLMRNNDGQLMAEANFGKTIQNKGVPLKLERVAGDAAEWSGE